MVSNEIFSQVRLSSAAIISYVNSKLKVVFVNNLKLITIFVKLYHAGTVCARRRARLLVCFDRPVGWKQAVRLHLINADFVRTSVDMHGQGRSGLYWTDGCDGKA